MCFIEPEVESCGACGDVSEGDNCQIHSISHVDSQRRLFLLSIEGSRCGEG